MLERQCIYTNDKNLVIFGKFNVLNDTLQINKFNSYGANCSLTFYTFWNRETRRVCL